MLEVLRFVFSSFWVWLGTLILLCAVCSVFCGFIGFLAEAFRANRPAQHLQTKTLNDN
jgi:hypothetical protein